MGADAPPRYPSHAGDLPDPHEPTSHHVWTWEAEAWRCMYCGVSMEVGTECVAQFLWRCLFCGTKLVDMGPGGAYCPKHDTVVMEWKAYETLLGEKHPNAPDKGEDSSSPEAPATE